MKLHLIFFVASAALISVGCRPSVAADSLLSGSTNDTSRLESVARANPNAADFVRRVEDYYKAIQEQDWATTYDMRVSEFKQDVMRGYYLKTMTEVGKRWHLVTFKILDVEMFHNMSGDYWAAELVVQFNESGSISYRSVRWKKRGGIWLCDEPGLSGGVLPSTRIPDWVTN